MVTQRSFEELNLWQRIFAEHWERFATEYEAQHGKGQMCCPARGSTKMLLIRIWSKEAGLVYDLIRDGVSPMPMAEPRQRERPMSRPREQLAFAFNETHVAQMLGCLSITGLDLALLLNFKNARLGVKRVVK